ncbi:GNAT family N-acetyltransferase [Teichococcus aestuarii]|uniref:GNAT family N-acetyltransferase n=1 Tax=Teichococcus aestuarii TaxID=568898 RepID=UPI00360FA7E7
MSLAAGIELVPDNKGPEAQAVLAGLATHRRAAMEARPEALEAHPLCFLRRDAGGVIRAGLVGEVTMDWLFIDKFWVDESLRGQGTGSALLAAAEAEARRIGAVGAHLYTSSFQAPAFYRKHGFQEIGRLEGRPRGHHRLWFAKRFGAPAG